MSTPIRIHHISTLPDAEHKALLHAIHGEETMAKVAAHNTRVEKIWAERSPNARPFTPSPSSAGVVSRVPADGETVLEVTG